MVLGGGERDTEMVGGAQRWWRGRGQTEMVWGVDTEMVW